MALYLALSESSKISISLWVLGGVVGLLTVLIGYIITDFKKDIYGRLKKIDGGDEEGAGALAKIKSDIQDHRVEREKQSQQMKNLSGNIESLKSVLEQLNRELAVLGANLSNNFQTKQHCDVQSFNLNAALEVFKKEMAGMWKEERETLSKLNQTLSDFRVELVKIQTKVNIKND